MINVFLDKSLWNDTVLKQRVKFAHDAVLNLYGDPAFDEDNPTFSPHQDHAMYLHHALRLAKQIHRDYLLLNEKQRASFDVNNPMFPWD